MDRRVVITAAGAITSLGRTATEMVAALRQDRTAFQRSPMDPEVVTCPVTDFDLRDHIGRFKNQRYLNRGAALAVAAAMEAIKASGLSPTSLENAGLFVGTGPHLDLADAFNCGEDGQPDWRRTPALWMLKYIANTPASVIAQLAGIHGESASIQTACAAGLQAIGEAFRNIRHGDIEVALAGAGDSRLNTGAIMAYKKAQAIFLGDGDPQQVCRPFDALRQGFVSGEGGAFFVLESLDQAQARGATIIAEIHGFGATMDGHAMTAPHPEGRWAETAVRRALATAGWQPDQVDLVSAHGTGTPLNDAVEADLLPRLFGGHHPAVIAIKSWIGHLSAACGAVELAVCLACMGQGYIPRIRNLTNPCRPEKGFVIQDRDQWATRLVLENFGFGGQNCALAVSLWTGT